jgi:anti-sigma-K factor RskA
VPASVALAVLCLWLSAQNRKLSSELELARHAAADFGKERQRVEEMVAALAAPDTITVKLTGTSEATKASGVVKYNPRTGTVLYSADQLPTLPAEKAYQMWLVPTSGAPISAGVFTPGLGTEKRLWSAQVPPHTEPKAFAVTIEPAGGVPAPTGPKVLLGAS